MSNNYSTRYFLIRHIFFIPMIILTISTQAFGWKAKAHLFFAEEALKDALDNDSISFLTSDSSTIGPFAVNKTLTYAIRDYSAQFRAGVIGPDAYPDILTGQQLIHPSSPGSCHWLNYLWNEASANKNKQDIAFTAGFLAHAAGDLFGHTFINNFAGGPFELGANALKHTVVEAYFDKSLPPITTWNGHRFSESDVSIKEGVEDFIYSRLVYASPNSHLERWLFMGKDSSTSIPKYFSKLQNSLQQDIKIYYDKLDAYDKDYESLISAAAHCDIWDFSCSKVFLYTSATICLAEKKGYQLLNGLIVTYKEYWRDDIIKGLKKWPLVSHEINMALNCGDSMNTERAKTAASDFAVNNLLSMIGAPDILGTTIDFISGVLDAIVPEFIQKAIDKAQEELMDFMLENTIGYTLSEIKDAIKHPETQFSTFGLNFESFKQKEMQLSENDSIVDYKKIPAAVNTVNMIKLAFLSSPELQRLMSLLTAKTFSLNVDNVMLGTWLGSLDQSCQWASLCDTMFIAKSPVAFSKLFRKQTGDSADHELYAYCTLHEAETADSTAATNQTFSGVFYSDKHHDYELNMPFDGKIAFSISATDKRAIADFGFLPKESSYAGATCTREAVLEYRFQKGVYNFDIDKVILMKTKATMASSPIYYTATVSMTPAEFQDNISDDSASVAVKMKSDSVYFRNIGFYRADGSFDKYDYFSFSTQKNSIVHVDFSGMNIGENVQFELYDSTMVRNTFGRPIGGSSRSSFVLGPLYAGQYYFRIRSVNPGIKGFGSYSIGIRIKDYNKIKNNSINSPIQTANRKPLTGILNPTDTINWFLTDVTEKTPVSMEIYKSPNMEIAVSLCDSMGNRLNTVECDSNRCGFKDKTLTSGKYLIQVKRIKGEGEYSLVLDGISEINSHIRTNLEKATKPDFCINQIGKTYQWSFIPETEQYCQAILIDPKGRIVRQFFSGVMKSGKQYQGEIQTNKLSPGIYLFVLKYSKKHLVQKLYIQK